MDSDELNKCISKIDDTTNDESLYESASQALSAMSDIGSAAGPALSKELLSLLDQRLANEMQIIGGGFEAAGRG